MIDELWVLVDVKVHRYQVLLSGQSAEHTTASVGGEIGWRHFLWLGAFVQPVLRYWPNVYTSLDNGSVQLGQYRFVDDLVRVLRTAVGNCRRRPTWPASITAN